MFKPNRFLIAPFCLHVCLNLNMCARMKEQFQHPVRASCAQCAPETLPEAEELAPSMAQAARAETARGRGRQDRISIPVRAVRLCHTAKGPSGGAFGLRWSLPGARPAQGHYSGNAKRFQP